MLGKIFPFQPVIGSELNFKLEHSECKQSNVRLQMTSRIREKRPFLLQGLGKKL